MVYMPYNQTKPKQKIPTNTNEKNYILVNVETNGSCCLLLDT